MRVREKLSDNAARFEFLASAHDLLLAFLEF